MRWTLETVLRTARRLGASDIHLVNGVAPAVRIGGTIRVTEGEPLDAVTLRLLLEELADDRLRRRFEEEQQLCFSRQWPELGRFRISVYLHAGVPEMAIRLCESTIRTREELKLPPIVEELTRLPHGLVLITGATGMGKTTTMSFMIDAINRDRRAKIVTIEDPVEYVHDNRRSIVVQQEVSTDTPSFRQALVHVLRQDPDVIVIGEMRDLETIETALVAAETGHLVIATLHTPDATQTVQRILGVFPAEQQNHVTIQLAGSLQAVVAQRLLPTADGAGRVLACEVLVSTPAIRKHIREQELHQLHHEVLSGKRYGMQSMDNALLELYQQAQITYDTCLTNARDPDYIRQRTGESPARPVRSASVRER
jgi:twitching motility protein PilT